ncbi:MAG TPA: (2Fe-2S)-binding protein, partial [Dermatophilaceae bacterium]
MNPTDKPPMLVRWTLRLEDAAALDMPVHALEPSVRALFGTGTRASVLRGDWLGHAVHPLLTDVVIGTWTS